MGRMKRYYAEQTLESIARKVLTAYDSTLYYGDPAPIPIEAIIEAHGLDLEYQYLRKNGRILGETIFDDGLAAIYDWDNYTYTFSLLFSIPLLLCKSRSPAERPVRLRK